MAIQKITISKFLQLAKLHPIFDVRSPSEFEHAHIPNAINLPLFTNDERKIVGTAYKQQSKQIAIKFGLDYFGVKMKLIVEEVEKTLLNLNQVTTNNEIKIIVHCWRGGMRSAAVAWLLDLYGFNVYTIIGGYKAYRKWALIQFEFKYNFKIIAGHTGSGKTLILKELEKQSYNIVDLESLANHKGSTFGGLGEKVQSTQEMFENNLANKLATLQFCNSNEIKNNKTPFIFIEDESQRIGNLQIPIALWKQIRISPLCFLNIPFNERLKYLIFEYGKFEKAALVTAIMRIQKRLGGLETKNAINFLLDNQIEDCFKILLQYYDKWYLKGLYSRENLTNLLFNIDSEIVDAKVNTKKIIDLWIK